MALPRTLSFNSLFLFTFLVSNVSVAQTNPVYSDLWGVNGEKWAPRGRLPDFSFAGYHRGEDPIPAIPVVASVKDYGAKGDGVTDDTAAINKAISSISKGAILIPAGTYKISNIIYIKKPNIVLRGEGKDKTIIKMTKSMTDILGASGKWSYLGGTIWVDGSVSRTVVAEVTKEADRGANQLVLSSVSGLSVGNSIRLEQTDVDLTLANALLGDLEIGSNRSIGGKLVNFDTKITAISGNTITIDRYLPVEVRALWNPTVVKVKSSVYEVGIENLQVQLPNLVYPGHFKEKGFNGIYLEDVFNSWVKDVKVHNGDTGVALYKAYQSTVQGVTLTHYSGRPDSGGKSAHRGIGLSGTSNDNLVTSFDLQIVSNHDVSLDGPCAHNVFEDGSGVNIAMDHHGNSTHINLFTNIHVGQGSRPFSSGGSADAMPHAMAYETFWNIRSSNRFPLPGFIKKVTPYKIWGPLINFVGLNTSATSVDSDKVQYDWHLETMSPTNLSPQNLRRAQLHRRTNTTNLAPKVTLTSPTQNQTYTAPASVELVASASDSDGNIARVKFYNGSTLLKDDTTSPYSMTWSNVSAGSYSITAEATDNGGLRTKTAVTNIIVKEAPTEPTEPTEPTTPGDAIYTIDAGSVNDAYFSGGKTFKTSKTISGTDNQSLYQSERYGSMSYSFPVANGEYEVELLFAEIYFTASGKRVFSVQAEGALAISKLDIFATVGSLKPLSKKINVKVSDGKIDLAFVASVNNPKVSGIVVRKLAPVNNPPVLTLSSYSAGVEEEKSIVITASASDSDGDTISMKVQNPPSFVTSSIVNGILQLNINPKVGNAGSYSLVVEAVDSKGGRHEKSLALTVSKKPAEPILLHSVDSGSTKDAYYIGGKTYKTSQTISGTTTPSLYQTERYGAMRYSFPVSNGNYEVVIKMAEIYHSARDKRVFSIKAEGIEVLSNIDIFAEVGKNRALNKSFNIQVQDGKVDLEFLQKINNPKVSGIEIKKMP